MQIRPPESPPISGSDDQEGRAEALAALLALPNQNWTASAEAAAQATVALPNVAGMNAWVGIGPRNVGGRITALAQTAAESRTLYAGTALGGAWRSLDAGDTWTHLGAADHNYAVGSLAAAPSRPQRLYVGTGDPSYGTQGRGLLISDDRGSTLARENIVVGGVNQNPTWIERIVVDPTEPERVWVATNLGLFRREPGPSWSLEPLPAASSVSDLTIDFSNAARYRVTAAVRTRGLYQSEFAPGAQTYNPNPFNLLAQAPAGFGRVKVVHCEEQPATLYAAFELQGLPANTDNRWAEVRRSDDNGANWRPLPQPPRPAGYGSSAGIAWYALTVAVHPRWPDIVYLGTVNLHRSFDGGRTWHTSIDWLRYDKGERAYHADQHAIVFDVSDDRRVWLGNDGGISESGDLGIRWRKRSHGIEAAQFNDITHHQRYPFIMGGGMQDNGCYVGYGGPTWAHAGGGDGGHVAFDPIAATAANPNSVRRFVTTWQGAIDWAETAHDAPRAAPFYDLLNPLPEVGDNGINPSTHKDQLDTAASGMQAGDGATWFGTLEHHPTIADHMLVARMGALYLWSVVGGVAQFQRQNLPGFVAGTEVTALAYAPSAANVDWWAGDARRNIWHTTDAGANWQPVALPAGPMGRVTRIAVHPTQPQHVAVALATGGAGELHVSDDAGVNWRTISTGWAQNSAITSLAFDPLSPADTLYAGTLAGVYRVTNAAPGGAGAAVWQSFNRGLPLSLIKDLALDTTRNLLRAATHGRGIFEIDLSGRATPDVQLYVRSVFFDDGVEPALPAANRLTFDPRAPGFPPINPLAGYDLRIDPPPYQFPYESVDGVEFDEELRSRPLAVADRNRIYVQVHNRGGTTAVGAIVHLYWAPAPGTPPVAPNLQANFWATIAATPAAPPAGPWRHGFTSAPFDVASGQPRAANLEWIPAADIEGSVAVLAVVTHATDPIPAALPLVLADACANRHVVARITATTPPDLYVRDAEDDDGAIGSVAWGGRSPDIAVAQPPAAGPALDPEVAFAALRDARTSDVVRPGAGVNKVYIRVHNPRALALTAHLDVYRTTLDKLDAPADWVELATNLAVPDVPAGGTRWSSPIALDNVPDPSPAGEAAARRVVLIAVLSGPQDPKPDRATIADAGTFWAFFRRGGRANNAAFRVVTYLP